MRTETVAANADPASDELDLVEMANLPSEDTGVPGIVYISSQQASHAPRVKWFPSAPKSRNDPCVSVTIQATPQAFNHNLPKRTVDFAAGPVTAWVALNHVALADFWDHGYSWTRQQVNAFIEGLDKL